MQRKVNDNKVINPTFLRYLVNFWTVILYAAIVADFFKDNGLLGLLGPIAAIYIALLTVFTAEKEFERWHDYNIGRHPGEIYVFLWTVLMVFLIFAEFTYNADYRIPSEIFSTYVVVVGILAITKKSKNNYIRERRTKSR